MKTSIQPFRFLALLGAVLALMLGVDTVCGQSSSATNQEQQSAESEVQAELLKAYIRLQAQLNEAQLAIEQNRMESQRSAREQAVAITDKLNGIQKALDEESARQQEELQKSNRALLWVAAVFGSAGMLAMLLTAMFQWRTMSRVSELSVWHPQLAGASSTPLLPAESGAAAGKVVELSNQRLMSVIERLERRVFDLEHTSNAPAVDVLSDSQGEAGPAGRILVLLGKGQSLLDADQPEQALACYNEILELDSNHPEALVKKGATLERLKQDEEALRCYDRAIEADHTLTIAYLYKGGVFNRLERYNEALECYEQALRVQAK